MEKTVLGEILFEPECLTDVVEFLSPNHFQDIRNKNIYTLMLDLYKENIMIDTISVYDLSKKRSLDIGKISHLTSLTKDIVTSANITHHSRVLIEQYIRKNLNLISGKIQDSVQKKLDVFEVLDDAQSELLGLVDFQSSRGSEISLVGNTVIEHLEKIKAGDISSIGVKTLFTDLDKKLTGLKNGDLIVLAARPSMGKTALALNILRNVSEEHWCAIFSLEMNSESLYTRLLSSETKISYSKLQSGGFGKDMGFTISSKSHLLNKLKLYIDDTASISTTQIMSKARKLKKKYDIRLIVVDYLQLMTAKADTREREIATISSSLKAIAKELNIPVLALSQLNRSVEARNDKTPQLSDLRESGAIEQDADVVLFLYRPEVYGVMEVDEKVSTNNLAQVIIGKQRNGVTGKVNLTFTKDLMKFDNYSSRMI